MDVFWELNPKYMYMYQDNYIKEKKEQLQMLDVAAYYQGLYVHRAIASCFNKRVKYPEKPYSLVKKEKPLTETDRFKLWIAGFNRNFKEKN